MRFIRSDNITSKAMREKKTLLKCQTLFAYFYYQRYIELLDTFNQIMVTHFSHVLICFIMHKSVCLQMRR